MDSLKKSTAILFLMLLVCAAFGQVVGFDYVGIDDEFLILQNPHIRSGLSLESVGWALRADFFRDDPYAWFWQPLTYFSRLLDVEIFGLRPAGHHLMNLLYHLCAAVLFFLFLLRATGRTLCALVAALLFALHPLKAEPVAWLASRKDLLAACFGFLSLLAYAKFRKRGQWIAYAGSLLAFAASLASKPMLIGLPFLLIALDRWPFGVPFTRKALTQKIPFLILSLLSCALAAFGQSSMLDYMSPAYLVSQVPVSYGVYLLKIFWPVGLGLRSLHISLPAWPVVALAGSLLLLLTGAGFALRKKIPSIWTGWLWFLVTFIPFVAILPRADRFSYFPVAGIAMAVSWSLAAWIERAPRFKRLAVGAGAGLLLVLVMGTFHQTGTWRDGTTLYTRALEVQPENFMARHNLGLIYSRQGRYPEAALNYERALQINPRFAQAWLNLGVDALVEEKFEQAIAYFNEALAVDPAMIEARISLAQALSRSGRPDEAEAVYLEALRRAPYHAGAEHEFALHLARKGDLERGLVHFQRAVELDPQAVVFREHLLAAQRQTAQAQEAR